jgi:T5SS/PEP-CTERM-associated repeat protein
VALFESSPSNNVVSFGSDVTNSNLSISGNNVVFNLLGPTYTSLGEVQVVSNGTLTINGGMVTAVIGYIGSHGNVTVNGMGSTWTVSGYLEVGQSGGGTLEILNGGSVSAQSSLFI